MSPKCRRNAPLVVLTILLGITTLLSQTPEWSLPTFITVSPTNPTLTNLSFSQHFVAQSGDTGAAFPLPGVNAVQLEAGQHACAVLSDQTVHCWPNDFYYPAVGPLPITGLGQVTAVSDGGGGSGHTCVLLADTTVKCWGPNFFGQLGDGTTTWRDTPVTVVEATGAPLMNVTAISAGTSHTCALLTNETVKCWGDNGVSGQGRGALGEPASLGSFRTTPVFVSGLVGAVAVSAGSYHTCVVLSDARVQCWGSNTFGALGDGTTTDRATPVFAPGMAGAKAVFAEGHQYTCALLLNETVKCSGRNDGGQLGNGTTTASSIPVTVTGLTTAKALSTGDGHACAVLGDSTVSCWGGNGYGNLGNGTTVSSSVPVPVSGLSTAVSVGAGIQHTCALLTDGTVQCWGLNLTGQLGTGISFPQQSTTPVATAPLGRVAWTSSNTAVAFMDAFGGDAISRANGTTTITAHYGPLTASTTLTVDANAPPVAQNDSLTTAEDTAASLNVLTNDSDPTGDALTVSITSSPLHGVLTQLGNGVYRYTPHLNYNGPDSFRYTANDGNSDSNEATVTITVTAVNDPPVANGDAFATAEDTTLTVGGTGVLSNDTDVDGARPTIAVLGTGPAQGTLNLSANGSFTYAPPANFSGPITFTYKASDGQAESGLATVTITVSAVNDPPVANPDSGFSVAEDGSLTITKANLVGNDTDPENDPLTTVKVTDPSHGTLVANADGSFTYTPAANYNGPDSFTYKASDGSLFSNIVTVSITVTPLADPPVAKNDFYTISQNTGAPSVLTNDTAVDGGLVTATLVTQPAHGTLSFNVNGTFTYVPASPTSGPDTFTYKAVNGGLESNVATVFVNNTCSISWKDAVSGLWTDGANWDQNRAPNASDDVCIGVAGIYVVTLGGDQAASNLTIAGTGQARPILSMPGTLSTDASLTVSHDVFSSGAINLEGDRPAALNVSGLVRNLPSGGITVAQGAARSLAVSLENQGAVFLLGDATFTGGTITNRGFFQARANVTFNATTFTQEANNLIAERQFIVSGGIFNYNGGNIQAGIAGVGTIGIRNSQLNFNSTNRANFEIDGTSSLSGGISPNSIVNVAAGSASNLTIAGDLTIDGLLGFGSGSASGTGTLAVVSGSLTNRGTFSVTQGIGGLNITGVLNNQGFVDLGSPTLFNSPAITNQGLFQVAETATFQNTTFTQSAGTLRVASSGFSPDIFVLNGGTFNFTGGAVQGALQLDNSRLNSTPTVGSGTFVMRGASMLTGTVRAGQRVAGQAIPTGTTLQVDGGVTNEGQLGVEGPGGSPGDATLNVTSAPLTNTGLLFVNDASLTGRRTISGDIVNQGTIDFAGNGRIAGGVLTNNGTVRLPSFGVVDMTGGTFKNVAPASITGGGHLQIGSAAKFFGTGNITGSIINSGEFNPGLSPGQLNITGNYQQDNNGVFVAEINGAVAGTDYDRMTVTGSVNLSGGFSGGGGTLRVNVAGGAFCPQGSFRIIAAGSLSGDFTTKAIDNPTSAAATATPSATGYDITFEGCGSNRPPVAANDTATTPQDAPVNVTVLANDTDPDQGDSLTVTTTTTPAHGSTTINNGSTITYTPNAGYSGPDSFQYTISDGHGGTATATVNITVDPGTPADTAPPQLTLPGNMVLEASGPSGAVGTFTATATDLVDGSRPVTCNPASSSTFALGTTTVQCSATDLSGNTANGSFTVQVVDTTGPALTLPANLLVELTGPTGAPATFTATSTDLVDGARPVTCIAPSGSTFPLGQTPVQCSATDLSGNTANGSFTVQVVDTTRPLLSLPGNLTVPATGPSGAVVAYSASATDLSGSATFSCTPPSGSSFAVGTTTVGCDARDGSGNTASGSFTVTVTPPSTASQITDLIALVNSFKLAKGYTNSLVQKLEDARTLTNAGRPGACGKLDDFIAAVNAQAGKELTQAQASDLITRARQVKALLGC